MSVRESDNEIYLKDGYKFAELISYLKDFRVKFTAKVWNDPEEYWIYIHND